MSGFALYPTLPIGSPKITGDIPNEKSLPVLNDREATASPRKTQSSYPELHYRNTNCEEKCNCNSPTVLLKDFGSSKVSTPRGFNRDAGDQIPALVHHSMRELDIARSVVDNISYNLNHDVKGVFQELATRLQHMLCQWIEDQSRLHQCEMNQLQNELAAKRQALEEQTKLAAKKGAAMQRLQQELSDERDKLESCRKLEEWKLHGLNDSMKKFKEHVVDTEYNRKLVKRAFSTLLRYAKAGRKQRCVAEFSERADTVRQQMEGTFADEKSQLEAELKDLRMDKERLQRDMGEFESAVQQALMRGLCSLNMEALKVIRSRVDLDHLNFAASCETQQPTCEEELTPQTSENGLNQSSANEESNSQQRPAKMETGDSGETFEIPKAVVTRHFSATSKRASHLYHHTSFEKPSHLPTRKSGGRCENKPITLLSFRKNV